MAIDWGWRGVAGLLAVLNVGALLTYLIWVRGLWTFETWDNLTFLQGLALLSALVVAVLVAKVEATCMHFCVVFWQVYKFKQLATAAANEQSPNVQGKVNKVLICHASVGAGHKRAAEAIAATIRALDQGVDVRVVDLMEPPMADPTLIYFYKDWYLRLVGGETLFGSMGGHCVGFFFDRANSVEDDFTGGGFLTRRITQTFMLHFLELIYNFKPDVVVHTHFLAPQLLASLRRRHNLQLPHVTVVTDMDVHAWWYQQPTDHYFVPRPLARHQLQSNGVPLDDISVSGIPIMPQFRDTLKHLEPLPWAERRQRLLKAMDTELDRGLFAEDDPVSGSGRPLVVQMSTGRGAPELYKYLLELDTPISLVVVCGRQADVRSELEQIEVPLRHRVSLLGFTRTIHELLAVADVVVTKPGGLITSEALACGVMMVVVDPYPGQEERNSSMLLEEGAGIWVWDYRDLRPKLDPILAAPPEAKNSLRSYKENARRLGRPEAAFEVAKYVLGEEPRRRMLEDFSGMTFRPKYGARTESRVRQRPKTLERFNSVALEHMLMEELDEDDDDEEDEYSDEYSTSDRTSDEEDAETGRSPASRTSHSRRTTRRSQQSWLGRIFGTGGSWR
eukprot:TRINITY_DN37441_c0_g1_i1.p1 TRINITY_DN37441_c0_g1~~TRINITY_DN37441_c0_g1_i1.p1  ORF type:complete len:677 (+),score=137.82 TRINITY_DN37441_c0_g1_i1:180-2033(+)